MTTGRPGLAASQRWMRDRLQGLGLAAEQLVVTTPHPAGHLVATDLEPASYRAEVAPLTQRVLRLLGGGRGVSIYVTGRRNDTLARHHAAVQIALGLAPHGRQVIIVDADFLRPGLSGLVFDPNSEGLIDMVRFGRSTRALLLHPVPEGPWVLPAGSFPMDDPAPVSAEALRSVVFRVSQMCDLAIYVGPLSIRSDIHPLARVCDHVLYAGDESEPEAAQELVDALGDLQRGNSHVLGVLWHAAAEAATLEPAPPPPFERPFEAPERRDAPFAPPASPPQFDPGFLYARDELESLAGPRPPNADAAAEAAADVEAEQRRDLAATADATVAPVLADFSAADFDWGRIGAEAEAPEPAASRDVIEPPMPARLDSQRNTAAPSPFEPFPSLAPSRPSEPVGDESVTQRTAPPARASSLFASTDLDDSPPVLARRSREESNAAASGVDLSNTEFAFESEGRTSRWPTILVLALMTLIVGFVGVALWVRHRAGQIDQIEIGAEQPVKSGGGARPVPDNEPKDNAASAPESPKPAGGQAAPNDNDAAAGNGTRPNPATDVGSGAVKPPATQAPATQVPPPVAQRQPVQSPLPVTPSPQPAKSALDWTGAPLTPRQSLSPPALPLSTPATSRQSSSAPAAAASPPAGAIAYGVHIASYQTLAQASKEIAALQKHGFTANALETDLGSKGIWYRVYVGRYSTVAEAKAASDAILQIPGYSYAQVHKLPR